MPADSHDSSSITKGGRGGNILAAIPGTRAQTWYRIRSTSVGATLAGALLLAMVFNILNFENGLGWIRSPPTGSR
jgi:hypothetical protein